MTEGIPTDDGELIRKVLTEVRIIAQLTDAELRRSLAPALSVSEFKVLTHFVRLARSEEPGHLARAFQQAKSSMTATLAKLERKGFISLDPDPDDKRKKKAMITPAGREAWWQGVQNTEPLSKDLAKGFDTDQLRAILPALSALRAFMDEARNERDGL